MSSRTVVQSVTIHFRISTNRGGLQPPEKMRLWSKEHRIILCFSRSLPSPSSFSSFSLTSTYPHTLLRYFSTGNDPSLNSLQFVPILSHGTHMALTRFCFQLQLCFSFIFSSRPPDKSSIWKLLYFLLNLPGNDFFSNLWFPNILSGLHLIIGWCLSSLKLFLDPLPHNLSNPLVQL